MHQHVYMVTPISRKSLSLETASCSLSRLWDASLPAARHPGGVRRRISNREHCRDDWLACLRAAASQGSPDLPVTSPHGQTQHHPRSLLNGTIRVLAAAPIAISAKQDGHALVAESLCGSIAYEPLARPQRSKTFAGNQCMSALL